ncbi:MAG: DUF2442 domain-containing protein [Thiocapsa sp.]|uniref:DUF2442 domain-containing protein n=1 Tax=Thiocapsa sp. TaxID=2024551 RepID=UPI001BCA9949|nr:DUF2442 domain-containing protein [Thiocapsa sp.]QVL50037.1 MAG: DUF2442 domain-containing protein [Thiocapsa sp.]
MTPETINITLAEQIDTHCLRLRFDDDTEQVVDFKPFLSHAAHPDIRSWLQPEKFASFRLEYGELVWGDYELCFPMIDLYRNEIAHRDSIESAA